MVTSYMSNFTLKGHAKDSGPNWASWSYVGETAVTTTAMATFWGPGKKQSLSAVVTVVYYLLFLTCTISTFLIYILKERDNTTVIPCIESPFCKAYTYSLFLLSIGYIVVFALETRRTACGLYIRFLR